MKNDKHPIDDLFQRGLNQHDVPPPMHVWERIEDQRGRRHRSKLVLMRQKVSIISSAAAVLLLGVWLGWSDLPELGSFPLVGGDGIAATPAGESDPLLELPAKQAGILPDVKAIIQHKKNVDAAPAPLATAPIAMRAETTAPAIVVKGVTETKTIDAAHPQLKINTGEPAPELPVIAEKVAFAPVPRLEENRLKHLPTSLSTLDAAPLPMPETGCARFSEGRPAIFFAVTAGPSLLGRSYSSKSGEFVDYARQRANSEKTRLSYGANARLSIVFPWGGAIRSGVGFTRFNEELVHRISNIKQVTITQIYGPNNNVIGADTLVAYKDTVLRFANQHQMIDIPLQLGYEVRYNKLTLAANAGVNINVVYNSSGSYLESDDLLPARFDNQDPDLEPVYKTNVGLSWQASLGLHYQLNDRLDIMAEPYLRYYTNSFTRDDYPLSQKYLVGGVGVGLRMLL